LALSDSQNCSIISSSLLVSHMPMFDNNLLFWHIIIISLLMSPLLGHRPSLWITHKETTTNNISK
jgi:hypothetical protein